MNNKINHFYISNGLKTIYASDNTNPLVSLQLFIKMGAIWEKNSESGYSHLLEHLVFKSTQKFPHNQLMDAASQYGSVLNAYTEYESTCFYLTITSSFLAEGLEILAEIAYQANFSDSEFYAERKVVMEELKQYRNDPEDSFVEMVPALTLNNSPYHRLIIGNERSLSKATAEKLRNFYRLYYTPEQAFLCIAGDFHLSSLKSLVRRYFHGWLANQGYNVEKQNCASSSFKEFNLHHIKKSIEHDFIAFGIPELSELHPLSYAQQILAQYFAFGKTSRLYQRLHVEEKLVAQIKTVSLSGMFDGVLLVLMYPHQSMDIPRIVEVFLEEYIHVRNYCWEDDELERLKKMIIINDHYSYEYMEAFAQNLGNEEILGDYKQTTEYDLRINQVSRRELLQLTKEIFDFQSFHIFQVGSSYFPRTTLHQIWTKCKSFYFSQQSYSQIEQAISHKKYLEGAVQYRQLSNGLKILLKKTPQKKVCGVSFVLGCSQLDEKVSNLGLNQFCSSMLMYGNEERNYLQMLEFCSSHGLHFSINCGTETTRMQIKCFAKNLLQSLNFLYDVYTKPLFPVKYLENLQKSTLHSLQRIQDHPQSHAYYLWRKMIFGDTSNLFNRLGNEITVQTFTRKVVQNWYEKKMLHIPSTICIVGDFDFEQVFYRIEKLFGKIQFASNLQHRSIWLQPSTSNCLYLNKKSDQSIIHMGSYCMPAINIEQRTAMLVLAQIIGGDVVSRMFTLLREKNHLAYTTEFDFQLLRTFGYYMMLTIVDRHHEKEAIAILFGILDDLRHNGIQTDELIKIKKYLIGQKIIDEESGITQSQTIGHLLTLGYDYQFYLEREQRINNVHNEILLQILNEYFQDEDQFMHILR